MRSPLGHCSRYLFALAVLALHTAPLRARERSPALVVKQGENYEEMVLAKLDVDVRIHGFLAETTSTMTFHNPHDRVLEGDIKLLGNCFSDPGIPRRAPIGRG